MKSDSKISEEVYECYEKNLTEGVVCCSMLDLNKEEQVQMESFEGAPLSEENIESLLEQNN